MKSVVKFCLLNLKDLLPDRLISPAVFHDRVVVFFIRGAGFYDGGVGVLQTLQRVHAHEPIELAVAVIKHLLDLAGAVTDGAENLAVHQRLTQLWKI